MIERDHERPKPAPVWMVTMSDMNMLLMVFFIALFSFGLIDKPHRLRTEERLRGMAEAAEARERGLALEEMMSREVGEQALRQVQGRPVQVRRVTEGVMVTIGGEVAPFAEGSYELRPEHREVLAGLRAWLNGRLNRVILRGYTAGNLQDSVVFEAGRVRPFEPRDLEREDRAEAADHWLLSMLRANAVRAELAGGAESERIDERRIHLRAEAYTVPVADSSDPARRGANRRVEVVVTNEIVPK